MWSSLAVCSEDFPFGEFFRHWSPPEQGGVISVEPRINDRIRVSEVRLIGAEGEQVGIVSIDVALQMAADADLDLVEVAPASRPPV